MSVDMNSPGSDSNEEDYGPNCEEEEEEDEDPGDTEDYYVGAADCTTIRKRLRKCADDSEMANYISTYTKDSPKCNICIEKNGGCNHVQCSKCKHDFCWMCLGDWETHSREGLEQSGDLDGLAIQNAAKLLAKCLYSLWYTYPYAYYMGSGPRKKLFDYQQAQLEAEIESLSWKVEHVESYGRWDLENQMHIAEQQRRNLGRDHVELTSFQDF
ncbi:Protein ariadne-2 [Fukomys damarensis]|uniref:RBR-type E3 ubiquitin transferase n=1 Tax=Fukomys damarensis TaxID=885580 RepID=A0A091E4Y5_FUKDA|nr:Protein ariadne-2 [Fukomys damarensis]